MCVFRAWSDVSEVFIRARSDSETEELLAFVELVFPMSVLEHQLVSSEHGRMFRCLHPSKVGYRDCGAAVSCSRDEAPIVCLPSMVGMSPKSSSEQGRIPRLQRCTFLLPWRTKLVAHPLHGLAPFNSCLPACRMRLVGSCPHMRLACTYLVYWTFRFCVLPSMVGCSDAYIRARSDVEAAELYFSVLVMALQSLLPSMVGCSEVLIRARSDTEMAKLHFLGFLVMLQSVLPSMVGCSDVFIRAGSDAETVELLLSEFVMEYQLVSSEHGRMFRGLDPSKVGYRDSEAVLPWVCAGISLTNKLNPALSKPYAWAAWPGSGPRRRIRARSNAEAAELYFSVLVMAPQCLLPSMVGCSEVLIRARSDTEMAKLHFLGFLVMLQKCPSEHGRMFRRVHPSRVGV